MNPSCIFFFNFIYRNLKTWNKLSKQVREKEGERRHFQPNLPLALLVLVFQTRGQKRAYVRHMSICTGTYYGSAMVPFWKSSIFMTSPSICYNGEFYKSGAFSLSPFRYTHLCFLLKYNRRDLIQLITVTFAFPSLPSSPFAPNLTHSAYGSQVLYQYHALWIFLCGKEVQAFILYHIFGNKKIFIGNQNQWWIL